MNLKSFVAIVTLWYCFKNFSKIQRRMKLRRRRKTMKRRKNLHLKGRNPKLRHLIPL